MNMRRAGPDPDSPPDMRALAARLARIRLSVKVAALQAGIHPDTPRRALDALRPMTPHYQTAFVGAVVQEEIALRDYLNRLHPPPRPLALSGTPNPFAHCVLKPGLALPLAD